VFTSASFSRRFVLAALLLAACRHSPLTRGDGADGGGGSQGASGGVAGASASGGSGVAGASPDASAASGGASAQAGAGATAGAGGGAGTSIGGGGRDGGAAVDATDAQPLTGPWGFPDAPFAPASCASGGKGLDTCGAGTESCCTSLPVAGGPLTSNGPGAAGGVLPASVSAYRLDKYLVTVGRFRQFVKAWNGGAGWTPPAGSGKHIHLNGGQGLVNIAVANLSGDVYESGWASASNANLAPTNANLDCTPPYSTWTDQPGSLENLPITCVSALEAQAFCIWDGGFLPSEVEWTYAAFGGAQARKFPWGSTDPGSDNRYAIYGGFGPDPQSNDAYCHYPNGALAPCTGTANIAPVGTATLGAGRWGQLDLVGDMNEWVLDSWDVHPNAFPTRAGCANCAILSTKPIFFDSHAGRFDADVSALDGGSTRYGSQSRSSGFRCARPPCEGGRCVCRAGDGSTLCNGLCIDEQTDPQNCGACGNVCPAGVSCKGGSCPCPGGKIACGGVCLDVQTDRNNCGACAKQCNDSESCQGARCVPCPGARRTCGNVCVDLDNDVTNCGLCARACAAGVACGGGACEKASCQGLPDTCGPFGENCCVANHADGGSYNRSNDPKFPATVSHFFFDDYEITVGRFRRFVADVLAGWRPPAGAGKHTHLNGGLGLNLGAERGWDAAWTGNLATTAGAWTTNLTSCAGTPTWTATAGTNESLPIDCLSWYEAYAFCIWDGGFLPTEAEWNFVAAGGDLQRLYPWADPPDATIDCAHANFAGCSSQPGAINPDENLVTKGEGAFGGYALAGNVAEWVLDAKGSYPMPCDDCANLSAPGGIVRGGDYTSGADAVTTTVRASPTAPAHLRFGARCARPWL
jgi:sulfatase modifying factor 1